MERKTRRRGWPGKNLKPFVELIESVCPEDYTLKTLSEMTGEKVSTLSNILNRDDMKLSKAEKIAQALGYKLRLYFPVRARIGLDFSVRKEDYPQAGNLTGLAKYLYDSNISIDRMCKRLGRAHSVLKNAFANGDIALSTLMNVIDNLGIDIIWKFESLNEDNYEECENF